METKRDPNNYTYISSNRLQPNHWNKELDVQWNENPAHN